MNGVDWTEVNWGCLISRTERSLTDWRAVRRQRIGVDSGRLDLGQGVVGVGSSTIKASGDCLGVVGVV